MKAIAINAFGGRDQLQVMDLPAPEPGEGEVLIRVKAAGVNPVDWKIREGWLKDMFPHEFPLIPGWDVAGVIERACAQIEGFNAGDEVYAYARKPAVQGGCYAEYVVLEARHVARKPASLSFEEAAAIPLAALTAYQSLFDAAQLRQGEQVLVHAAAGGVGSFAVQLARHAGATVWATASESNHDYLKSLGAAETIDYRAADFRETLKNKGAPPMDVVFDCVGGAALADSPDVMGSEGRLVSIVDPVVCGELADKGFNVQFVFVEPNAKQLDELSRLVEAGELKTHLAAVLPLEEAVRAHELIETQHTRGKIVLTLE